MGYGARELEEIPDEVLTAEIKRRLDNRKRGLCPYCGTPVEAHGCMMKDYEHGRLKAHPEEFPPELTKKGGRHGRGDH